MADMQQLSIGAQPSSPAELTGRWLVSLPLAMAAFTYAYLLANAQSMLRDGDTLWHIAAGRWIVEHRMVPDADPFSWSMPGAAWTAHEWLAEVLLAGAHQLGGWTFVAALPALALAFAIGLLTRALLRHLEPVYAFLFAALALFMIGAHALARPHLLAMPLLMAWAIELARAADERRVPGLWLLPLMAVWANLHAGFVMGIALAVAFAGEALLGAWPDRPHMGRVARTWGLFILAAAACALLTPHGVQGYLYTWDVLRHSQFALSLIGEWRSPNFQVFQPLTLWLLGGLALVLHQGLKLPPVRLAMLVGLMYIALKHLRNVELVGFLGPLLVAAPFARQWQERRSGQQQLEIADGLLRKLSRPAGARALALAAVAAVALPACIAQWRPVDLPVDVAPAAAVRAAQAAGAHGGVMNQYDWGGYLIYLGVPVFIDGRGEMYGDEFMKAFVDAKDLMTTDGLEKLIARYHIQWTLLRPGTPAIALLDRLPGWRRVYSDETAVVHVRSGNGR